MSRLEINLIHPPQFRPLTGQAGQLLLQLTTENVIEVQTHDSRSILVILKATASDVFIMLPGSD